jgi:hypothetical protein
MAARPASRTVVLVVVNIIMDFDSDKMGKMERKRRIGRALGCV